MTTRKYSSIAQETTLTSALGSGDSTMIVASSSALLTGISLTGTETFTVVIDPDTALEEIVDVIYPSSGSSNTLTISRNIDSSIAISHSAGAKVRHMGIGRDYREANTHIETSSAVHGITGSVVGTTDTQTLTNKTLTTPTIASFTNATHSHLNAAGGGTITSAAISDFQEAVEDTVGAMVSGNSESGISVTYDDATGKYNFDVNDPVISIDGDIAGSATMTNLGNVTINTGITAGVIVNADISGVAAIAASKIAGTAITAADTGTVTSTMIANDTIVNADINSAAAIAYSKLNLTGSITSSDIANGTIVDADVSGTAAIAYSKLSLGGTITSADLVDGTIVNSDINASAGIALSKLATDPLARANHTGTQTASTISDFDTQVRTSKVTDLAAPTGSFSMNNQKITSVGTPTLTADAATKGYVDTQVSALVNGAPSTLDTLKEIADAISSGGTFYDAVVLKGGSTMTGALVLNADPSVNLGAATKQYVDAVAGSATAAAASAAAAATTYDNFDDRYLGAKSSAPSVDNDGNALITGAIYWNSSTNAMYAWTGTEWGSISSTAAIFRYRFTASGGETSLSGMDDNGVTLSYLPAKEQVYLNGVLLVRTSDYSATNGTSITSLAALTAGDIVEIITFTSFELATAIDKTILDAKGDLIVATAADTPGKLTVGSNGQYLKADSTTATGLAWGTIDTSSNADIVMTIMGAY